MCTKHDEATENAVRHLHGAGLAIEEYRKVPVSIWAEPPEYPPQTPRERLNRSQALREILSRSLKEICGITDGSLSLTITDA